MSVKKSTEMSNSKCPTNNGYHRREFLAAGLKLLSKRKSCMNKKYVRIK